MAAASLPMCAHAPPRLRSPPLSPQRMCWRCPNSWACLWRVVASCLSSVNSCPGLLHGHSVSQNSMSFSSCCRSPRVIQARVKPPHNSSEKSEYWAVVFPTTLATLPGNRQNPPQEEKQTPLHRHPFLWSYSSTLVTTRQWPIPATSHRDWSPCQGPGLHFLPGASFPLETEPRHHRIHCTALKVRCCCGKSESLRTAGLCAQQAARPTPPGERTGQDSPLARSSNSQPRKTNCVWVRPSTLLSKARIFSARPAPALAPGEGRAVESRNHGRQIKHVSSHEPWSDVPLSSAGEVTLSAWCIHVSICKAPQLSHLPRLMTEGHEKETSKAAQLEPEHSVLQELSPWSCVQNTTK